MSTDLRIVKNDANFDARALTALLHTTWWANDRPQTTVEKSVSNSLCCFAYDSTGQLIGFARAITDYATNYYVCDVIVDEAHRGKGIGTRLIEALTGDEEISRLKGLLVTNNAHALYRKFGFYSRESAFMQKDRTP